MIKSTKKNQPKIFTESYLEIIIALIVIIFNIFLLVFPRDLIGAARNGLDLWISNVLPSLLPFIIGTNLLISLGAVKFFGVLLSPIMTKVFRVPSAGGFALVTGLTSGYPIGAKVISGMRENGEISKTSAERLLSFCNNSGPLFIIGAVGATMFGNPSVGYAILFAHYASAILNGFLFRFYKYSEMEKNKKNTYISKEKRNLGKILSDSVFNGVQTILLVGGFIILFSVFVEILFLLNIVNDTGTISGIVVGSIEMTNGAKILAINHNIIATAAIISFGGLSIHAQTLSFISKTDISIKIYFISKITHALLTVLVLLLTSQLLAIFV